MAFLENSVSVLLKNGGYLDITLSYNSSDQQTQKSLKYINVFIKQTPNTLFPFVWKDGLVLYSQDVVIDIEKALVKVLTINLVKVLTINSLKNSQKYNSYKYILFLFQGFLRKRKAKWCFIYGISGSKAPRLTWSS